ncbi:MAG: 4-hydroxy-tetrahydrodipicolinate reductase [Coriobacteriales bacterium]|jgi:4-hydroxy-tetrahydrodipicolinate reductase|nr:4-hydroxy-tetrahydrodipicolinate reductase [Coriobacteriales bacterium]
MKVIFNGYCGRMGQVLVPELANQSDIQMVAVCDVTGKESEMLVDIKGSKLSIPAYTDLKTALDESGAELLVDFTVAAAVPGTLEEALSRGVHCIVGTTGVPHERYEEMYKYAKPGTTLFYAPNFTLGAVLMQIFAEQAAPYFEDVEVIEFHHTGKKDAPSGTAVNTAKSMAKARLAKGVSSDAPGAESEISGCAGARGAKVDGIPVHSVRGGGYMAHQEVILSSMGQTLVIRHDSIDRRSYLPGLLLAIRRAVLTPGLTVGLNILLDMDN